MDYVVCDIITNGPTLRNLCVQDSVGEYDVVGVVVNGNRQAAGAPVQQYEVLLIRGRPFVADEKGQSMKLLRS
jgi:hypothetical protein